MLVIGGRGRRKTLRPYPDTGPVHHPVLQHGVAPPHTREPDKPRGCLHGPVVTPSRRLHVPGGAPCPFTFCTLMAGRRSPCSSSSSAASASGTGVSRLRSLRRCL